MRLATWNCRGKSATNIAHLLDLDVDVAVVCEAQAPVWTTAPNGRVLSGQNRRVQPGYWHEVVVLACSPWSVTLHEAAESAPAWTLPVRVDGPTPFILVGIHTFQATGIPNYEKQIDLVVDWMAEVGDPGPSVVAGDFNSPIETSQKRYDAVAGRLQQRGLLDVYRASRVQAPAHLTEEPTYYRCQQGSVQGFHIDHVWVPAEWAEGAEVRIGDFDTWVASGRSDHVPVVADVRDRRLPGTA